MNSNSRGSSVTFVQGAPHLGKEQSVLISKVLRLTYCFSDGADFKPITKGFLKTQKNTHTPHCIQPGQNPAIAVCNRGNRNFFAQKQNKNENNKTKKVMVHILNTVIF